MSSAFEAVCVTVKEEPLWADDSHSSTAIPSNWPTDCVQPKKELQTMAIKKEGLDPTASDRRAAVEEWSGAAAFETPHQDVKDCSALCETYLAVPGLLENDDSDLSPGDKTSFPSLPLEVTMTEAPLGGMTLHCVLCEFSCLDETDLTKHVSYVHLESEPFLCRHCNFITSHKQYFRLHMSQLHPTVNTHKCNKVNLDEKPFLCDQCDYATSRKKYLNLHVSQVHCLVKTHKCSHCDYAFARKGSLNEHVSQVHMNVKPHQCPECEYASARRSTLRAHIASAHSSEKPFKCHKCDYSARLNNSLTEHISSVHLNIKPFQCFECDYATCKKSNLKSHMIQVHYKAKPFKCDKCKYSSVRKSFLKKHVSKMHPIEVGEGPCDG